MERETWRVKKGQRAEMESNIIITIGQTEMDLIKLARASASKCLETFFPLHGGVAIFISSLHGSWMCNYLWIHSVIAFHRGQGERISVPGNKRDPPERAR